ncbi:MAG: hypothetical protein QNK19_13080 [Xanthomonadales bacterium]|nr:hypothetical protein [Xanthomonadales bacterium]
MIRKVNGFSFCYISVLLFALVPNGLIVSSLMADEQVVVTVQTENHQQAIQAWRASRYERLMQPDGWLTLVGLEWLEDGESRVGTAADNDIQLSDGPAYWGSVVLQIDKLHFNNHDTEKVKINDEPLPYA